MSVYTFCWYDSNENSRNRIEQTMRKSNCT